jgi:hypothetical protein
MAAMGHQRLKSPGSTSNRKGSRAVRVARRSSDPKLVAAMTKLAAKFQAQADVLSAVQSARRQNAVKQPI